MSGQRINLATLGNDGRLGEGQQGRPSLYGRFGLRRFRALMGDVMFKQIPIVCVGDSITAGQGGDNVTGAFSNVPDNTQGWVGQLRTLLGASPGSAATAEGFIFCDDSRITVTGAANNNWACVPLRHGYRLIKNTQKIEVTIPEGVTGIGVIQANMPKSFNEAGSKLADATASYKKGAGAETALTALTNTGIPVEQIIAVTAGEVFTVFGPATAQSYIVGLRFHNAASTGFLVDRIGQPGQVSGDMLGGEKVGALLQAASAENQQFAARAIYRWAGAAGLIIVSFGTNDQSFQEAGGSEGQRGVTLAKYTEWMEQFANQAIADGWCVLILGEPRNAASEATGGATASMDEYWAAMKAYAQATEHVAFLDIGELWGNNAAATAIGLTEANTVHPLRPGHGDIARTVRRAILGDEPVGIASLEAA
jgi:lysophospholipase L1-like esterase